MACGSTSSGELHRLAVPVRKCVLDAATSARVGIDGGATLSEIVFVTELDEQRYCLNCLLLHNSCFMLGLQAVRDECQLRLLDGQDCVKVTGTGYKHEREYRSVLHAKCEFVIEALCWVRGCYWAVRHLDPSDIYYPHEEPDHCFCKSESNSMLDRIQENLRIPDNASDFPAVLVNAGNSIAMCVVDEQGVAQRVSTCFFSGKTLLGLAAALLGTADYGELMEMADAGDRRNVDLSISELTANDPLNAFSFCSNDMPFMHLGKIADCAGLAESASKSDMARSLVSLFSFNLFGSVLSFATAAGVSSVFLCGNVFLHSVVRKEFENAKRLFLRDCGFRHQFLKIGGQIGSIGALISDNDMAPEVLKFAA